MRALPTKYNGYTFRSRTEARWAVFLDALGIVWNYEVDGFLLSDGSCYLPDFEIIESEKKFYLEVKSADTDDCEGEHIDKLRLLSKEADCGCILANGPPSHRLYNLVLPWHKANSFCACFFKDWEPKIEIADQYWFQTTKMDENTGILYWDKNERGLRKSFGKGYMEAISKSRSERFGT